MRRVVVVGQGYVGLPLAHAAVRAGHTVVGYDIDRDRLARIAAADPPVTGITGAQLAGMLASGRYRAGGDAADLDGFDVALVTVPTPLRDGRPDPSQVWDAARVLAPRLRPGCLVALESTVAPGTTAGEFRAALEAGAPGLRAGEDFHLAFSPERVDPGSTRWTVRNTPKLVGGLSPACTAAAHAFYATLCERVVVCPSPQVAELAKLLENVYRQVNIAMVNELARHAHELGVSMWDVVDAAATKPFGYQPFYPGPGVGGHCIPVDPVYLSDRVETSLGVPFAFACLATRVNDAQPGYIVERAAQLLGTRHHGIDRRCVLVLGLAYKANVGDIRQTPAVPVIHGLLGAGVQVRVADPRVPDLDARLAAMFPDVKPVPREDLPDAATEADLVLLLTDHDDFPYEDLARRATLVLDTRRRFPPAPHVHLL